jgi:hypothetical protein
MTEVDARTGVGEDLASSTSAPDPQATRVFFMSLLRASGDQRG